MRRAAYLDGRRARTVARESGEVQRRVVGGEYQRVAIVRPCYAFHPAIRRVKVDDVRAKYFALGERAGSFVLDADGKPVSVLTAGIGCESRRVIQIDLGDL